MSSAYYGCRVFKTQVCSITFLLLALLLLFPFASRRCHIFVWPLVFSPLPAFAFSRVLHFSPNRSSSGFCTLSLFCAFSFFGTFSDTPCVSLFVLLDAMSTICGTSISSNSVAISGICRLAFFFVWTFFSSPPSELSES